MDATHLLHFIYLFPKSDIGKHLSPLPKWLLAWSMNYVSEQNTHILSGSLVPGLRCRILLGIWIALLLQSRQARSKHLETSCVPPELAVVAELSHDFALLLQIYSLWALYQLDWKLYPTYKHELCYKDTPIYFLLFFVKILDQINRLCWLHGLCSPLPLSVVLFLMAVSPPSKYIN